MASRLIRPLFLAALLLLLSGSGAGAQVSRDPTSRHGAGKSAPRQPSPSGVRKPLRYGGTRTLTILQRARVRSAVSDMQARASRLAAVAPELRAAQSRQAAQQRTQQAASLPAGQQPEPAALRQTSESAAAAGSPAAGGLDALALPRADQPEPAAPPEPDPAPEPADSLQPAAAADSLPEPEPAPAVQPEADAPPSAPAARSKPQPIKLPEARPKAGDSAAPRTAALLEEPAPDAETDAEPVTAADSEAVKPAVRLKPGSRGSGADKTLNLRSYGLDRSEEAERAQPPAEGATDSDRAAAEPERSEPAVAEDQPPVRNGGLKPGGKSRGLRSGGLDDAAALAPALDVPQLQAALPPLQQSAAGGLSLSFQTAPSSPELSALLGLGPSAQRAPQQLILPGTVRPEPQWKLPGDIEEIYRGSKKKKLVALTFDDGPHPEYSSQLLATLDRYGVKATFFLVGIQCVKHPQWVKMTYQAGHEIGNHTYDHFRLTRLPLDEKLYQIDEMQRLVAGITGEEPRFLRPPGGQLDGATLGAIKKRRLISAMWDVNVNDLKEGRSADEMYKQIVKQVRPGSIILAHDGSQATVDMLPRVIEELHKQGYRFVTLSELTANLDGKPEKIENFEEE